MARGDSKTWCRRAADGSGTRQWGQGTVVSGRGVMEVGSGVRGNGGAEAL